jgi:hypothetical protein
LNHDPFHPGTIIDEKDLSVHREGMRDADYEAMVLAMRFRGGIIRAWQRFRPSLGEDMILMMNVVEDDGDRKAAEVRVGRRQELLTEFVDQGLDLSKHPLLSRPASEFAAGRVGMIVPAIWILVRLPHLPAPNGQSQVGIACIAEPRFLGTA